MTKITESKLNEWIAVNLFGWRKTKGKEFPKPYTRDNKAIGEVQAKILDRFTYFNLMKIREDCYSASTDDINGKIVIVTESTPNKSVCKLAKKMWKRK